MVTFTTSRASPPQQVPDAPNVERAGRAQPSSGGGDGLKLVDSIQQSLIRVSILNHNFRLSLDREHNWPATLFHAFHEDGSVALEIRERMNVFREVDHYGASHEISI